MPIVVIVHHLKNFDEWIKVFKADPHQKLAVGDCYAEAMIAIEFTLSGRLQRRKLRP